MKAEAGHFSKTKDRPQPLDDDVEQRESSHKRQLVDPGEDNGTNIEDAGAKRRRILEETRDIDADSDESGSESSDEERQVFPTWPRQLRTS